MDLNLASFPCAICTTVIIYVNVYRSQSEWAVGKCNKFKTLMMCPRLKVQDIAADGIADGRLLEFCLMLLPHELCVKSMLRAFGLNREIPRSRSTVGAFDLRCISINCARNFLRAPQFTWTNVPPLSTLIWSESSILRNNCLQLTVSNLL